MCLCSAQLISPDYLSHRGRWIWVRGGSPHCHTGWPRWGWWGGCIVWATRSFCMSVSFHNSSAKRDCQASLWFWRSIRSCQPAVTTERWGSHFHIPAGQLASTLFPTLRDNKTISVDQEHLLIPSGHRHSPWLPSRYAAVLESPWLILLFFFCYFTFCLPNETFPLLQSERSVIAGLHRCEQIAVSCTLTPGLG